MLPECRQRHLLSLAILFNSWLVTVVTPCDDRCEYTDSLKHANCFNRELNDIPDGCEAALTLDAGRNHIREIGASTFQGYDRLEYLYISSNEITSIAAGAFQPFATTLQSLDLGSNRLSRLDQSTFENMINLRQLDLQSNQIVRIESQTLKYMHNLKILLLSNNAISSLAYDAFDGLVNLTTLHLNSNRLLQVNSRLFVDLGSLLHLRLSNNSIVSLDGGPLSLYRLRSIDISLNNISVLDCGWINQTSPDLSVDVSLNMIQNVVNCQSQLNKLLLHDNPFNCSCDNRDLAGIFRAYERGEAPTCWTPPGKRNMNITEKTFEDCFMTGPPKLIETGTTATTVRQTISVVPTVVTSSPIATKKNLEEEESTTLQAPSMVDAKAPLQSSQQTSNIVMYSIFVAIGFLTLLVILLVAILIRHARKSRPTCDQSYMTGIPNAPLTAQTDPPSLPRRHIYQEIPGEQPDDQAEPNPNDIPLTHQVQVNHRNEDQNNNNTHLLSGQYLSDSQDSGLADQSQRNSVSEWIQNHVTYIPVESLHSVQMHSEQLQLNHPDPPREPYPMPQQHQPILHRPPHESQHPPVQHRPPHESQHQPVPHRPPYQSQHQPVQNQSHYQPHHWSHHQQQHQLPHQHHPQNQPHHQPQYQPNHQPQHQLKHQPQHHLPREPLNSLQQTLQDASPRTTSNTVTTEKRRRRRCSSCNCQANKPRECHQQISPPSKPVLHPPDSRKGDKVTHYSSGYVSHGFIN